MQTLKINIPKLKQICLEDELKIIPKGSNYYFKDNGSNILAVAHCDYVCTGSPDFTSYVYKGVTYILSETLDDRLGVYLITSLLPTLGINVDILLTTDEEIGASTAQDFVSDKNYNWIFSFDRRGNDIVAYDYEDNGLNKKVKKATGQKLAWGSFSDIVYLEHLGVKGLNFGCGYNNEHTAQCYATVRSISRGVENFVLFYNKYKDTVLPHTPPLNSKSYYLYKSYDSYYPPYGDAYADEYEYERIIGKKDGTACGTIYMTCDICDDHSVVCNWVESLQGFVCKKCEAELKEEDKEIGNTYICELCGLETHIRIAIEKVKVLDQERELCYECKKYVKSYGDDVEKIKKIHWLMDWEDKDTDSVV